MKKAIILAFVLIVVFSSHLFSETLDYQQSFELGKIDAKEEHKVWAWYLLGIASGLLAQGSVLATFGSDEDSVSASSILGRLGGFVFTISPFVPALLLPKRENISPYSSGVDLEGYRDGYKRRAKWKNCGALLLGELTGYGVVYVVGFIVIMSSVEGLF